MTSRQWARTGLTQSTYTRPALEVPEQWRNAPVTTGTEVALNESWWHSFNDPQLDALIEKALRTNNDLAAATLAVYRARLQSGLVDTNLTPDVSISASGSITQGLTYGGDSRRATSAATAINYELDLWGRLARERDAAAWQADATAYDRRATALALIGTTANLYWRIAHQNRLK